MTPTELLETFLLALAVYREGRGESLLGKLLIAQTIENRVRSTRWPESYRGVILQPAQFSAFSAGDPNVTVFPSNPDLAWDDCVAAAEFVMKAPRPLTSANHYCTTAVSPAWADPSKVVAREGHHVFYAL